MRNFKNILLISVSLLVFSCKSQAPLVTGTVHKDSTAVDYKQQTMVITGAKVTQTLNMDSLIKVYLVKRDQYIKDSINAVKTGKPVPEKPKPDVQYLTDPQTKAQLSYWIDQYGKLNVGCESKDQTIQLLVAQVKQLHQELTTAVKTEYRTPWYDYLIIIGLIGVLILVILKK